MGPIIGSVQQGTSTILRDLGGLPADLNFGVGNYKDFPADPDTPYAFQHQQSLTSNTVSVTTAISSWTAKGGDDVPEGQLFALDQLAQPPGGAIGWRSESKRIVVWFGDAPGNDPVCQAISGLSYEITEASVTAKLVAEQISVLAISTTTGVPYGLDDNPIEGKTKDSQTYQATSYRKKCGPAGGTPGQATRIAKATGGTHLIGVDPASITKTIIDQVKVQVASIGNVRLVASGATAPFVTAIAPKSGHGPLAADQEHALSFDISFLGVLAPSGAAPAVSSSQLFKGSLDVVADGVVVGAKSVTITVPALRPGELDYLRIPLLVELYDHAYENFSAWTGGPGRRLLLCRDTPDLGVPYVFDNTVSSLKIRAGPNFDPSAKYEVSFYRDPLYKGSPTGAHAW
jgi:hypothetical protein